MFVHTMRKLSTALLWPVVVRPAARQAVRVGEVTPSSTGHGYGQVGCGDQQATDNRRNPASFVI